MDLGLKPQKIIMADEVFVMRCIVIEPEYGVLGNCIDTVEFSENHYQIVPVVDMYVLSHS
jgi:hypothetical protein